MLQSHTAMVSVALTDQERPPSYSGEPRGLKKKNCKLREESLPGTNTVQ